LGDRALEALAANNLGETARLAGNDDEANEHYQASLRLYRNLGCRSEIPRLIHNLGYLALHAGDSAGAREHFRESLSGFQAVGMPAGVSQAIAGLAAVSAAAGTPAMAERALRLWAASAAALEVQHIPIWPADRAEWQRYRTQAQALLGSVASATAGEDGEAVSLEEAIGQALAV
jgi:tetratricopeptide (TPR) repeat protein